jgi:transposase-like protein
MRCSFFNNRLGQSAVWSKFGLHPRKPFSSSNRINDYNRRGADKFDREILELHQQGFTTAQIAQQLPGFGFTHIHYRLRKLRANPEFTSTSTGKVWNSHEDAVLMEKRKAGLKFSQIAPFLPGRNPNAVRSRYTHLKHKENDAEGGTRKSSGKPWSPEEKQRVIDMVLVDRLSFQDIAKRLGRTLSAIRTSWRDNGRDVLPEDMLKKFRGDGDWTIEEDKTLIEQRKRGLAYEAIRQELSGRSTRSLISRAQALGIARTRLSTTQIAAVRKDLQAVLDGTAKFSEVASKLSSSTSIASLKGILYRMRHGYYKK